ncbi:MAG: hypothetical protein SPI65_05325 [Peptoniphilus sp.]|nr:hypothetical protein [Peptoniphilus sp.]MDD7362619.1 hypothetical protein [Bacillota bacterium]MDY6044982.1 hypothetical protein [Peptoniphilus sp.]
MKYYVIEGKFKTFEYSLHDEAQAELRASFEEFIKERMDAGNILIFGEKAHGLIGLGKAENLDEMLSEFERDPLTLEDVIEYRIVEIEDAVISDAADRFF